MPPGLGGGKGAFMQSFMMTADAGAMGAAVQFLPFVLIMVVFYFMMIRPQKKREKAVQEMRNSLEVGDELVTVGGIIGTVVVVKDDYLVIETGSDRSKVRVARWAVQANLTSKTEPAPPPEVK